MVSIPSRSCDERQLAELLVEEMQRRGLSASLDSVGNAVGVRENLCEPGGAMTELLLLGHMDTVAGEVPVRIDGERLYGRGAVDAKGPLAAFVVAAAQAELPPGTRVIVVGAVEEEVSSSRGAHFVADRYHPSACVIGEPSGWDGFAIGYKGTLTADYFLQAPTAHSAGPARSVADLAVEWWTRIDRFARRYNRTRGRLFDQLLPVLKSINTATDGLADEVSASVGLRLPPEFDVAGFGRLLHTWARPPAEVRYHGYQPAFVAPRRSALERLFRVAIRGAGGTPRATLKTGTSDMNVVGPRWNCPILAYGPGDSLLDHAPDEHIMLSEYLASIAILRRVLETSAPRSC